MTGTKRNASLRCDRLNAENFDSRHWQIFFNFEFGVNYASFHGSTITFTAGGTWGGAPSWQQTLIQWLSTLKSWNGTSICFYALRVLLLTVLLECISLYYRLVLRVLWFRDTSSKKDYLWRFKLIWTVYTNSVPCRTQWVIVGKTYQNML